MKNVTNYSNYPLPDVQMMVFMMEMIYIACCEGRVDQLRGVRGLQGTMDSKNNPRVSGNKQIDNRYFVEDYNFRE